MTKKRVYEVELTNILRNHFTRLGFQVFEEVPLLERRIDLVALKDMLIAVEVKAKKWKSIIKQIHFLPLFADKSYAAFSTSLLKHVKINYFKEYGIGVIVVDPKTQTVDIIVESRQSTKIQKSLRDIVNRQLLFIENL